MIYMTDGIPTGFLPEEHIGHYINYLSKTIRYAANISLEVGGEYITGEQCRLMSYISRRLCMGQTVYQKDIEKEFNVKRSSVTSILSNLEKSGYILRKDDEKDRRTKIIILTEKGVFLSERMEENIARLENVISEGMSMEERAEYIRLTKLAISNVKNSELFGTGRL